MGRQGILGFGFINHKRPHSDYHCSLGIFASFSNPPL